MAADGNHAQAIVRLFPSNELARKLCADSSNRTLYVLLLGIDTGKPAKEDIDIDISVQNRSRQLGGDPQTCIEICLTQQLSEPHLGWTLGYDSIA